MTVVLAFCGLSVVAPPASAAAGWSAVGAGTDGIVYALASDPSGNIYIGGSFTAAGGLSASRVAMWNGSTWSTLGSGVNGNVNDLAFRNGKLYAVGTFTQAGGVAAKSIAVWDGVTWAPVGSGVGTTYGLNALVFDSSGNLYVAGGSMSTMDGVAASGVAKWDGSSWSAMGSQFSSLSSVYSLIFHAGSLFAGGSFEFFNGTWVYDLARWSGTAWVSANGGGDNVRALASDGRYLYAGGRDGTTSSFFLTRYDSVNATWDTSPIGNGGSDIYSLLSASTGTLYVGGTWGTFNGTSTRNIATWNGNTRVATAVGTGVSSYVYEMLEDSQGRIWAGGHFQEAGGVTAKYIAVWSDGRLAPTFSAPVRTSDGFTVNVTNYDAAYTWTPSISSATVSVGVASGSTLPLTITGLAAGVSRTLTVTASRTGYASASATVIGQAKSAQTVSWAPTTAITTSGSPLTPSSAATSNGDGAITYSKVSSTTTSCSVDSSTGALTYSGAGTCTVRATAAETAGYLAGTTDVTFTVSRVAQSVTWSPTGAVTTVQSPLTPSTPASALGGASISYSKVSNTTTSCSVDSSTGVLTYSGSGTCTVRATAAQSTNYDSGFTDVTFTISRATPTLTWNPSLSQEVPAGSTTFSAASTNSDGVITYAVTNAGSTGCSLPALSRTLAFSADGSCEVTATVAGTTDYNVITSVKTFAISKAAQTVTWSPPSTLSLASISVDLGPASTSGDGAISYSVTSAGGTGCAFADATRPVLTYASSGSCSVTATAASTAGYAQATSSTTLAISRAIPTVSWSPVTALAMPAATVAPAAATTTGDGSMTYAVTSDSGAGCSVNAGTGALTYAATGQCQVTATSVMTTRYSAGSTAATFTVALSPQSITATALSTSLQPGASTSLSVTGASGTGAITWTRTTGLGVCAVVGSTVTAVADGTCVITGGIAADIAYMAASSTVTITVTSPVVNGGTGGGGSGGTSDTGIPSRPNSSTAGVEVSNGSTESTDQTKVPGAATSTRGRTLPPRPRDVQVTPIPGGSRSTVRIRQPEGAAGSQVLATVVVVRDSRGAVVSRISIALEPGQSQATVTVPFVASGYLVNVYNVNEVGVSDGALRQSPLVRATTITARTSSGQPTLFGTVLGRPIYFNGGSAVLDARDRARLRAIAQVARVANERVFVTGFARRGAGPASELATLSTRRARAAATYLVEQGVRVWTRYWGAGSLNGSGSAGDRRVEVRTSALPIPRSLVP